MICRYYLRIQVYIINWQAEEESMMISKKMKSLRVQMHLSQDYVAKYLV